MVMFLLNRLIRLFSSGATDEAQAKCLEQSAAFVLTPCCLGKVKHALVFASADAAGTQGQGGKTGKDGGAGGGAAGAAGAAGSGSSSKLGDAHMEHRTSKDDSGAGDNSAATATTGNAGEMEEPSTKPTKRPKNKAVLKEGIGGGSTLIYPRSSWLRCEMSLGSYFQLVRLSDYSVRKVEEATPAQLGSKALMDADRLALAAEAGYVNK